MFPILVSTLTMSKKKLIFNYACLLLGYCLLAFALGACNKDPTSITLLTDAKAIQEAKETLEIEYAAGESSNAVSNDLTLSLEGRHATVVRWHSTTPEVISTNGVVSRSNSNTTVILTATLSRGSVTDTKAFHLTVIAAPITDIRAVELAKEALEIEYASGESSNAVSNDLTLPLEGRHATAVRWHSGIPEVISTNGVVSRSNSNTTVILTATLSRGFCDRYQSIPPHCHCRTYYGYQSG